ncbi:hypothetical protein HK19_15380 [Acetobacter persici]|uniref:hypothetical protein n=1 Tax=Acetobacter persici TaxID=1076596 RepID=UPI000A3D0BA4|nr:hypothetical protein [Acetobacter persici]OUI89028.1 hypothetical protein HK19_15380 [Acetobacter persici]
MFSKFTSHIARMTSKAKPIELPDDGGVIDEATKRKIDLITGVRSQREVASLKAERNVWRFVSCGLVVGIIFAAAGWRKADDRWANDVRIAWVKLQPDGRSEAALWNDGGNANRFYEPFINTALINFVEHRYRHIRSTIVSDYGYAAQFMSPQLRAEFLGSGKAADEATAFEETGNGGEYSIKVSAIDHNTMVNPDVANRQSIVVDSTVYISEHPLDGSHKDIKKIVKITWRLTPLANLQRSWEQLRDNGPGIEILSYHEVSALDQGN